jgi:hypothetical protein
MIASLRDSLSKLSRAEPFTRRTRAPRRARLGFYGYRYRKGRRRSIMIARTAAFAILLVATIAAAILAR